MPTEPTLAAGPVAAAVRTVNGEPVNEWVLRRELARIIESYTLTMVGADTQPYLDACVDDVLAEVVGWPVRYPTQEVDDA